MPYNAAACRPCALKGRQQILALFLPSEAAFWAVATQDGKTPQQLAVQEGHDECARLLEINADADANNTVRPELSSVACVAHAGSTELTGTSLLCPRFFPPFIAVAAATGRSARFIRRLR
jgi:ankyrin repeat protein